MSQAPEMARAGAVAPQNGPGAAAEGIIAPAGIARPGANGAADAPVREVRLAEYAAAGYPDLWRGMVITVERPWSWMHPMTSALAWGIRRESTRISGHPARASHAMLYVGGGRCASQGRHYEIIPLADYRGCTLRFWDWLADNEFTRHLWRDERNALGAEAVVHVGQDYGVMDVVAQQMRAATGNPAWLDVLADPLRWDCSEAVCHLVRDWISRGFGGPGSCDKTPQELEDWMMTAPGWRCVALRLV